MVWMNTCANLVRLRIGWLLKMLLVAGKLAKAVSIVRHPQLLREISREGHVTFSAALAIRVYVFCHSVSIGVVPWKRAPPWCVLSGGVVRGCGVAFGFVGQRRWRGSGLSIEPAHCGR
jgi:hypothetical protein